MEFPHLLTDRELLLMGCVAGVTLMLWLLKIGLDEVETSLEPDEDALRHEIAPVEAPYFDRPEAVSEVIGQYMGLPIYRSVRIDGIDYYYDRIESPAIPTALESRERLLEPGIVYSAP